MVERFIATTPVRSADVRGLGRANRTERSRSGSFAQELQQRTSTRQPAGAAAPAVTQSRNGTSPLRQNSVTVQPSSVTPPVSEAPLDLLKRTLDALGVNTSGMRFEEQKYSVGYPGGAYENHVIAVDFGGGRSEKIDVRLMRLNPAVAAGDILRAKNGVG